MDTTQIAQEVKNLLPAFFFTLPGLCLISLLGMFTHYMKKNIKGETTTEIAGYFRDHFRTTLISAITTLIATAGLYAGFATGQPMDIITVFTLGLSCDSLLNKWEAKANPITEKKEGE